MNFRITIEAQEPATGSWHVQSRRMIRSDSTAQQIANRINDLIRRQSADAGTDKRPVLFGDLDEDKPLLLYASVNAEDCDTCWYLLSDQTDIPRAEVIKKLRAHLTSGHTTTSED
jgi:hypothetical protein